jgi:hypothetical protein
MTMREAAEFTTRFTPFTLAGERLRNRITHASMNLLVTPAGRVTDRLVPRQPRRGWRRHDRDRASGPHAPSGWSAAGADAIAVGDARALGEAV